LGTVARSLVIVLGLLVAADALGLDLSSLKIVLGALSVGIGFGLQNVVNNFVSGLILMFERTIKRGDIVRISQTEGRVASIGLRSSVIRTRAGHDIIVPNGDLVAGQVDNLSFTDEDVRIEVPFGVSYASDPNTVREIVLEVAARTDLVRPSPEPDVLFMGFGESSLDFELRVWVSGAWVLPRVRSALLFDVWYALKGAGIEIPFPQRDLHVRSGVLEMRRVPE
jgi:small-conductance mechanosensitive channel